MQLRSFEIKKGEYNKFGLHGLVQLSFDARNEHWSLKQILEECDKLTLFQRTSSFAPILSSNFFSVLEPPEYLSKFSKETYQFSNISELPKASLRKTLEEVESQALLISEWRAKHCALKVHTYQNAVAGVEIRAFYPRKFLEELYFIWQWLVGLVIAREQYLTPTWDANICCIMQENQHGLPFHPFTNPYLPPYSVISNYSPPLYGNGLTSDLFLEYQLKGTNLIFRYFWRP